MKRYHSLTPIPCPVLQPLSSFPSHVKQPRNSSREAQEALRKSPREERVKFSDAEQDKETSNLQTSTKWSLLLLDSRGRGCHWPTRASVILAARGHFCSGEL